MRLALTLCGCALLFGCARGSARPFGDENDAGVFVSPIGAGEPDSGASGGNVDSATNGGGNPDGTNGSGGSDGTNGDGDGGADGSDGSDAGNAVTCSATASGSCTSPADLGEVIGNQDGSPLTQTGTGSAWFKLTVIDDDSNGYVESTMGIGLTLATSGASANYDLFLYRDGDTSCGDNPVTSVNASGEDKLDHIWNGSGPLPGETRTLIVEVRQVSATCAMWSLQIQPHPCSTYAAPAGETCATK